MKGFLRRLRGIIKTGLVWAVGWGGLYGAFLLVAWAFGAEAQWDLSLVLRGVVFNVGGKGFIAGSSFGVILSILERHKKLEALSFKRIALWGSLAGLVIIAKLGAISYLSPVIIYTVLGVGSATGTVALAKRASGRELPEGDDDSVLNLEGEDESLPALEGE
jgi:hypothetical protein